MNNKLKRIARFLLGRNGFRYIRGLYRFNGLDSPQPLLKAASFNFEALPKRPLENTSSAKLVYLISPMQRSGTNYLYNILKLHPRIATLPEQTWPPELFLLSYSHSLIEYTTRTAAAWSHWTKDEGLLVQRSLKMLSAMGNGIVDTLDAQGDLLLVKTPDSMGLKYFFHLFPHARVIILTRDGRDTIDSYMSSWGGSGNFRSLAKRWNDRALQITRFIEESERAGFSDQIHVLDYDNLNRNSKDETLAVLNFLRLANDEIDWASVESLPVLGSSKLRGGEMPNVNWHPVAKPKDFNQVPKWSGWSSYRKRIFKKYAGQSLIALGYESGFKW